MAFSKIILNGVTQMDLTQDTTNAARTLQSYTGHGADGEAFVGTIVDGNNLSYGYTDGTLPIVGVAKAGYAEITTN